MINKDQLTAITIFLIENVWRNERVMYCMDDDTKTDLIDIVTSLHNLLYESITGNAYDYAFHWSNKIGCWVDDKYFNDLIGREKKKEEEE